MRMCSVGLLVLAASVASPGEPTLSPLDRVHELKSGEYLSVDYLTELKKTRSPFHACKWNSPQLVMVTHEDGATRLVTIFNFHEGGPEIVVGPRDEVSVPVDAGENVANLSVASDGLRLRLGFGRHPVRRYVFVGTASAYVANRILAGSYVDGRGSVYEFRDDGRAIFPDRKFEYAIGVDHVVNRFDYFVDKDTQSIFGYRADRDHLYVYRTTGALGQAQSRTPELVLKRFSAR